MSIREPKAFSKAQLIQIVTTIKDHLSVTEEAIAKMCFQELVDQCNKADRDLYLATLDALRMYPDVVGKSLEVEQPQQQSEQPQQQSEQPQQQSEQPQQQSEQPQQTLLKKFEQQRPQQWKENLRKQAKLAYQLVASGDVTSLKEGYHEAAKRLGLQAERIQQTKKSYVRRDEESVSPQQKEVRKIQEMVRYATTLSQYIQEKVTILKQVKNVDTQVSIEDVESLQAHLVTIIKGMSQLLGSAEK